MCLRLHWLWSWRCMLSWDPLFPGPLCCTTLTDLFLASKTSPSASWRSRLTCSTWLPHFSLFIFSTWAGLVSCSRSMGNSPTISNSELCLVPQSNFIFVKLKKTLYSWGWLLLVCLVLHSRNYCVKCQKCHLWSVLTSHSNFNRLAVRNVPWIQQWCIPSQKQRSGYLYGF